MPAEQGNDAERFAAAVDTGRTPYPADAELLRDLEIVAMLRSRTAAYAPDLDAKARTKQRLAAMLAAEQSNPGIRPPAPSMHRTRDQQTEAPTAPLGRLLAQSFASQGDDSTSVTTQMPAVTAEHGGDGAHFADCSDSRDAAGAAEVASDFEPSAKGTDPGGDGTTTIVRSGRRGRHTMPSRPGRFAGSRRPERPSLRRRAMLVGAAAMVFMVTLAGGGIFASRNALPGDSLYGVKRAAESAGIALVFDDAAKARRHLELASNRLDEIERMAHAGGPASADPALYRSAIQDFDTATGAGSRILLANTDTTGPAALGDLKSWAATQAARLSSVRSDLPAPAAAGADDSIELLDRLRGRAEALESRSDCTEVTSGAVDDLGSLPAEGTCAPKPVDPTSKPGRAQGGPARADGGTTSSGTGSDSAGGATSSGSGSATTEGQSATGGLLPGLNAPDLGLPNRLGSAAETGRPSTSSTPTKSGDQIRLPLPLLPPITLPPLLPGQPGITIG